MKFVRTLLLVGAIFLATISWSYLTAVSDPIVRRTTLALLPERGPDEELRLLLISDIHVAGPDMTPKRLARIVAMINGLRPDIVLIAGDLISDKKYSTRRYSMDEAVAPLRQLHPRLGVIAVLGNHDHWRSAGEARGALRKAGIVLLENDATRVGPLVIGGLDDAFTRHDDLLTTLQRMKALGGVPVLLSHSPDPFPKVPADVRLMMAGHTHCGQVRLPLIGAVSYMSRYGDKYACGEISEQGKILIVSAGLGTSILPLRLGTQPDMWLITLKQGDRMHTRKAPKLP